MKKIKINKIDEEIYYEKLDNGLDVYLYRKEDISNNYVTFTTKFGSIYNEFVPIGEEEMIKVPYGVAHYLEHKLFAEEDGSSVEDTFASNSALCNAYTTFKNTTYLFSSTDKVKENTLYLIDYVQRPYFTKENVDTERGIITEEIHMCDDDINDVMYEHIRNNCFHNNNFKDSIIGTVEDISKIDKDILYTCYNTFYHPSNMFLVVCGNFDVEDMLSAIKENQSKKEFKEAKKIEIKKVKEDDSVVKKEEIINKDTEISKVSYNIKIKNNTKYRTRIFNLYIYLLFTILFDETSEFDYDLKKDEVITNTIYFNLLNCDSHLLISLINETNEYEELIKRIEKRLKNLKISEEDFERKKRVLISNEIFSYENIEVINDMIIDNIIFNNKIEDNIIEIVENLNIKDLEEIVKTLDLTNVSKVIIKKNK